jgi:hypothetical protein
VLGGGADLVERAGKHAQPRGAQIGAMRVAEIGEQPFAGEIRAAHRAAVGVDEGERAVGRELQLLGHRRADARAQHQGHRDMTGKLFCKPD